MEQEILTDGMRLVQMSEELDKEYDVFGAYYDYNELDVLNLKNPIFEK